MSVSTMSNIVELLRTYDGEDIEDVNVNIDEEVCSQIECVEIYEECVFPLLCFWGLEKSVSRWLDRWTMEESTRLSQKIHGRSVIVWLCIYQNVETLSRVIPYVTSSMDKLTILIHILENGDYYGNIELLKTVIGSIEYESDKIQEYDRVIQCLFKYEREDLLQTMYMRGLIDVNYVDVHDGLHVMMKCAKHDFVELASMLMRDVNIRPNYVDWQGRSILMYYCNCPRNYIDGVILEMVSDVRVRYEYMNGEDSAILYAIRMKKWVVVERLLEKYRGSEQSMSMLKRMCYQKQCILDEMIRRRTPSSMVQIVYDLILEETRPMNPLEQRAKNFDSLSQYYVKDILSPHFAVYLTQYESGVTTETNMRLIWSPMTKEWICLPEGRDGVVSCRSIGIHLDGDVNMYPTMNYYMDSRLRKRTRTFLLHELPQYSPPFYGLIPIVVKWKTNIKITDKDRKNISK